MTMFVNTYIEFFQSDNLSTYEIIKTLKESLIIIGELVIEIPPQRFLIKQ